MGFLQLGDNGPRSEDQEPVHSGGGGGKHGGDGEQQRVVGEKEGVQLEWPKGEHHIKNGESYRQGDTPPNAPRFSKFDDALRPVPEKERRRQNPKLRFAHRIQGIVRHGDGAEGYADDDKGDPQTRECRFQTICQSGGCGRGIWVRDRFSVWILLGVIRCLDGVLFDWFVDGDRRVAVRDERYRGVAFWPRDVTGRRAEMGAAFGCGP